MADEKKVEAVAAETAPAKKAPAKKATAPKSDAAAKPAAKASAEKKAPAAKATAAKDDKKSSDAKAPAKATAKKAEAGTADASSAAAPKAAAAKKKSTADTPSRPQVLKVHHLRPAPGAKKDRTRVGRGEGSKGKTAGRGTKGTKARYQVRPGFAGGQLPFHMRSPKLRGFKNPFRIEYQVVNLGKLAELYPAGGDVTVSDLVAKGAVRKNEKVKVLGNGEIAVKLNVVVDKVSGSAEEKIVAAGGSVK
ncbi:50S ribosomal protein L15 [Humibacter sp. RRB41]|uniref:50S ribosomal protein L15 n=1 Tax=Humibacter sp. RRB41 TaxID=2919946 RepID=UPI001FAAC0DB|nr:50S ribosomal protein L15 [Humibacter sp. RRB41]